MLEKKWARGKLHYLALIKETMLAEVIRGSISLHHTAGMKMVAVVVVGNKTFGE